MALAEMIGDGTDVQGKKDRKKEKNGARFKELTIVEARIRVVKCVFTYN